MSHADRWRQAYLNKLPMFDLMWTPEIKAAWFECVERIADGPHDWRASI